MNTATTTQIAPCVQPNGHKPGEVIAVQRTGEILPTLQEYFQARIGGWNSLLVYLREMRGAAWTAYNKLWGEVRTDEIRSVLQTQLVAAMIAESAIQLQAFTGTPMPGTWPPPEPVRVEVANPQDEAVLREIYRLRNYGNCPDQRRYVDTQLRSLLGPGS